MNSYKLLVQGTKWKLPIVNMLCISFVVLGICFLAAINSSRKVHSDSIIDSVRTIE
ncbi:hypothetical protein ACER0A_010240 [Haloimpatiens sp. FM7315]|uniref:hypothetical protein n=1 Tax=Haloimpatiens sp. FM7315 TaxID=3298609 RepID=UPI0039778384